MKKTAKKETKRGPSKEYKSIQKALNELRKAF